jgi:hypothetical protein
MIRVRHDVEADLRWYHGREYEGEMGRRSSAGGLFDALERGAACQLGRRQGDVSDRARAAARRLRMIEQRLQPLAVGHRAVLASAFGPTVYAGLECYGEYPGMMMACRAVAAEHQRSRTDRTLAMWLARLAHQVRHGEGRDQLAAANRVTALRQLAEGGLAAALEAYDFSSAYTRAVDTVSAREIAEAMQIDPKTAGAQITARGIQWNRRSQARNARGYIDTEELATRWPEAAAKLGHGAG